MELLKGTQKNELVLAFRNDPILFKNTLIPRKLKGLAHKILFLHNAVDICAFCAFFVKRRTTRAPSQSFD